MSIAHVTLLFYGLFRLTLVFLVNFNGSSMYTCTRTCMYMYMYTTVLRCGVWSSTYGGVYTCMYMYKAIGAPLQFKLYISNDWGWPVFLVLLNWIVWLSAGLSRNLWRGASEYLFLLPCECVTWQVCLDEPVWLLLFFLSWCTTSLLPSAGSQV